MNLKTKPPLTANVGDEVNFKHGRFQYEFRGTVKEVIRDQEFFTNRKRTRYFIETADDGSFIAEPYDLF